MVDDPKASKQAKYNQVIQMDSNSLLNYANKTNKNKAKSKDRTTNKLVKMRNSTKTTKRKKNMDITQKARQKIRAVNAFKTKPQRPKKVQRIFVEADKKFSGHGINFLKIKKPEKLKDDIQQESDFQVAPINSIMDMKIDTNK